MQLTLHLGAHKTATTFLQEALRLSKEDLFEEGTLYVPLLEVRPLIHGILKGSSPDVSGLKSANHLLVSDETILGSGLYPEASVRTEKILQTLQPTKLRAFLVTRDYATFFPSMYCEYLRHREFVDYNEFMPQSRANSFSWIKLIDDLSSVVGEENLTVLRYEDLKSNLEPFFKLLAQTEIPMPSDIKKTRRSFTAQTVNCIRLLSKEMPKSEIDKIIWKIHDGFAPWAGYASFQPYSGLELEKLTARYQEETEQLKQRF